jgi:hypothetical protein
MRNLFHRPIALAAFAVLAFSSLTTACSPAPAQGETRHDGAPREGFGLSETQPVSFTVRFKAEHPLGRAQALEAQGQRNQAERLARRTVAASPELQGLCIDRFTLGGAEIVLVSCQPVPKARRQAFERTWIGRLRGMSDVEYADVNVVFRA